MRPFCPFSLCIGDRLANLWALANGACPSESVCSQLWRLHRMGFPEERLLGIIDELAEMGHTTRCVEQAHAGTARVLKHHPEMQTDSVQCRAFMESMRALVTPPVVDVKVARVHRQVERLCSRRRRPIRGREIYLQRCFARVAELSLGGGAFPQAVRKHIMATHAAEYARLSDGQKAALEDEAADLTHEREAEIRDKIALLEGIVSTLEAGRPDHGQTATPWCLEACKMSEDDFWILGALCENPRFSRAAVEKLRRKPQRRRFRPT